LRFGVLMRRWKKLTAVGALAFVFAGGLGVGVAANADSASSTIYIGVSSAGGCARGVAATINSSNDRGQLNVTGYAAGFPSGCASGQIAAKPAGHLGSNAYLKQASGAVCSSVSTTYSTATTAYKSSMAYMGVGSCSYGTQLSGGGRGYVYSGAGYSSAPIEAPYQAF